MLDRVLSIKRDVHYVAVCVLIFSSKAREYFISLEARGEVMRVSDPLEYAGELKFSVHLANSLLHQPRKCLLIPSVAAPWREEEPHNLEARDIHVVERFVLYLLLQPRS